MNRSLQLKRYVGLGARRCGIDLHAHHRCSRASCGMTSGGWVERYEPHVYYEMLYRLM